MNNSVEDIETVVLITNDYEEESQTDLFDIYSIHEEIDENYYIDKIKINNNNDNNNKCLNYTLCKNNAKLHYQFCSECFIYFNKILKYKINDSIDTCPLCFMEDKNMIMISLYKCSHTICLDCLYNIFWDFTSLKNIPQNPIKSLKKKWIKFLKTNKGCYIQYKLINKILYNYYKNNNCFDNEYDLYFEGINTRGINTLIVKNLKELVHYQLKYKYFIYKFNNDKKIKELAIRICPYCKAIKN